MTQNGDPYENSVAEGVNYILKTDFRLNRVCSTFGEAARAVKQSIYSYNYLRPHMSCGHLTPAAAHASTEPLRKRWKLKVYKTTPSQHHPKWPDLTTCHQD